MGYKYEVAIWTNHGDGDWSYVVSHKTNSLRSFIVTLWKERKNPCAVRAVIR